MDAHRGMDAAWPEQPQGTGGRVWAHCSMHCGALREPAGAEVRNATDR